MPPSGKALYRELLRLTRQLPAESRSYYQQHIRGHVVNHSDEQDPERLVAMVERARADARWVLQKPVGSARAGSWQQIGSTQIALTASASTRSMPVKQAVATAPALPRWLLGLATTLAWMVVSSVLIMANKRLYANGFPFPLATTGLGQAASVAGGYLLARAARLQIRPWPPLRAFAAQAGPVVAACVATMYFGNAAYLHLSVAFIQILKACTPAVTLALSVAAGLETLSAPLVVSMVLIAGGTGWAVLAESGAPTFSAIGLGAFALSSVGEAARVVWSQRLMGPLKVNQAEVLVWISVPSAACLLAASAAVELPVILRSGAAPPFLLLASATCVSCLVNVTSYAAIATTSSLTFKVAGCVKNIVVVWLSVVAHAEHVGMAQVLGYLVSMMGFALYSMTPRGPRPSEQPVIKTHKSV